MPIDLSTTPPPHRFNIRLACFDIDGTIVDHSGSIAEPVLREIRRIAQAGVGIALASGRPYFAARDIGRLIGVNAPSLFFSGGLVIHPLTEAVLLEAPLQPQEVTRLIDVAEQHQLTCELYTRSEYFVSRIGPTTRKHATYLKRLPQERPLRNVATAEAILKVVLIADGEEAWQRLRPITAQSALPVGVSTGASHPEILFANFTSPEADREHGFHAITTALGIQPNEVAAFGDAAADLPFLLRAGAGVAMANAPAEVRAQAPYCTASVEKHGVATALRALIPAA